MRDGEMTPATLAFTLNGRPVSLEIDPRERLSTALRYSLGLTGTKVGCNAGDCGACTVLVDGEQLCACLMSCGQLAGKAITTVEGLSDLPGMAALQQAFLDHGAAQCGICTPGMLMAAADLLQRDPRPDQPAVQDALGGVLCRCTGYQKIVEAVCSVADGGSMEAPEIGEAVGARMVKTDGAPKVSGGELYGADTAPEGALWLRVIRSP
ncbi:(2Fe-2S)-binding protein, partial [Pelagibius sp.]|uniref:(2Fe-2S)-binding protein n=1 Tax=Pelagibius sp. TaxID=1931238 RepID=UPI0026359030